MNPQFIYGCIGLLVVCSIYCLSKIAWFQQEEVIVKSNVHRKNSTVEPQEETFSSNLLGLPNETEKKCLSYGSNDMHTFVVDGFRGQFCHKILNNTEGERNSPRIVAVTFGCDEVFRTNGFGTGNFLMSIYKLRTLAEDIGATTFSMTCFDAFEQRDKLILPWLTGVFTTKSESTATLGGNTTLDQQCRALAQKHNSPLGERVPDLQFELRKMAVALFGVPSPMHPSHAFAEKNLWSISETKEATTYFSKSSTTYVLRSPRQGVPPLLADAELDETVLHFRCGDLIDSTEPRYGFMKFDSYANHISSNTASIGIVTEAFDLGSQHRQSESGEVTRERCRLVVTAFQKHLQQRFPATRVRIRNGEKETIASAYGRMIMANRVIVALSTFAFFPAVATFGEALVRRPSRRNLGSWIVKAVEEGKVDSIKLIDEPDWLPTAKCKRMWGDDGQKVLEWFHSKTSNS